MSPDIPPPPGPAAPAIGPEDRTRRRRRSSHRGKQKAVFFVRRGDMQRGRIVVIVMFVVERLFEFALCISPQSTGDKGQVIGSAIISAIWCTALTVGILRRMNWCRYVLIFVEFAGAGSNLAFGIMALPVLLPPAQKIQLMSILALSVVLHGCIAWVLARSRDIKRLTSRAQD
jgi:hypothetical protein